MGSENEKSDRTSASEGTSAVPLGSAGSLSRALHEPPGGLRPGRLFRLLRRLYHRLPGMGYLGPWLKAGCYGLLGACAPGHPLVQRYRAWQALQARKRAFREPLFARPERAVSGASAGGPGTGVALAGVAPLPGRADILIFPVIDWDYRFQRPQQLARCLARLGHRVFYLDPEVDARGQAGGVPLVREECERIWRVLLPFPRALKVYEEACSPGEAGALRTSLERLLAQFGSQGTLSLIDHPGWFPIARWLPDNILVYDCMDYHPGFGGMDAALVRMEEECAREADLLVVTAARLAERFRALGEPVVVRNASDHAYFSRVPEEVVRYEGRPVLGYYGAIAEWFDGELVAGLARAFPEALIVLIGDTLGGDLKALQGLENVRLLGEIPYPQLTRHLYGFDVCLLPFRINELTLATNPVKVYEYLSAGKPVVAVRLPELEPLGEWLYLADDLAGFCGQVRRALEDSPARAEGRQAFAARQTWPQRAAELLEAVAAQATPRVSVIVLTFNNLELTRACLESLLRDSHYPNLEILVPDNGSTDGTAAYLEQLAAREPALRPLLLGKNLGFAAGNNQAARQASGEFLVFLNNDTVVTPGWVRGLLRHFKAQQRLGLLGPVTNNIGNEARVALEYRDHGEMLARAGAYCRGHAGESFPLRAPAFFCVMVPRRVWAEVGPLDERYGLGFFEDDDYAMRVRQAGYQTRCAEDVFIHHHLSATFDRRPERENAELFERNRRLFEEKWGPWVPHRQREGRPGTG